MCMAERNLVINVPDVASLSLPFLWSLPSTPAQAAGDQAGIEPEGRNLELLSWVLMPGKLCSLWARQRRIAKPQQLSGLLLSA